jgi:hypothetical protein
MVLSTRKQKRLFVASNKGSEPNAPPSLRPERKTGPSAGIKRHLGANSPQARVQETLLKKWIRSTAHIPHRRANQTLRRSCALRQEKDEPLSVAVRTQTRRSRWLAAHVAVRVMLPKKLEPLLVVVAATLADKTMRVPVKKILDIVGSVLRLVVPLVRKKKGKEK